MAYRVKEIFYTLQGEGLQTGRPAVFCRFSGCNLWSGRVADRSGAVCTFCDTDFVGTDGNGGGVFEGAAQVTQGIAAAFPSSVKRHGRPFVVLTGGEPALQADIALVRALHGSGFEIAVETNGTLPLPEGIDWVTVSPKAGTDLAVQAGDELKLVYPQSGAEPELFEHLGFSHFCLQPADGPERQENTRRAVKYCLSNPQWRVSLQIHKILGIP